MLTSNNPTLGKVTQSRTALALFAATVLLGAGVTEAAAKSKKHHHHHSHHGAKSKASLLNANAAIAPSSGS